MINFLNKPTNKKINKEIFMTLTKCAIFLTVFTLSFSTFADCRPFYKKKLKGTFLESHVEAETQISTAAVTGMIAVPGGLIASSTIGFSAFFVPVVIAGATVMLVTESSHLLYNHKRLKMIRLINEAYSFLETKKVAGKTLSKFYRKVNKKNSQDYSIEELATFIAQSNQDDSLCQADIQLFQPLVKGIRQGTILVNKIY